MLSGIVVALAGSVVGAGHTRRRRERLACGSNEPVLSPQLFMLAPETEGAGANKIWWREVAITYLRKKSKAPEVVADALLFWAWVNRTLACLFAHMYVVC